MVMKCRFCGGNVVAAPSESLGVCDRCGQVSTISLSADENLIARLNRGHFFRRAGEYGKAVAAFSEILDMHKDEAEAYFGRALSRHGVLYTCTDGKLCAECHIQSDVSFQNDPDYNAALSHSDDSAANQFRTEADLITGNGHEDEIIPTMQEVFRYIRSGDWENAGLSAELLTGREPDNAKAWLAGLMIERRCRKPEELKDCVIPLDESSYFSRALETADSGLASTLEKCNSYIHMRIEHECAVCYEESMALLGSASSQQEYRRLYNAFSGLGGYRDSAEKAAFCLKKMDRTATGKPDGPSIPSVSVSSGRNATHKMRSIRKLAMTSAVVLIFAAMFASGLWLLNENWLIPQRIYSSAEALLQSDEWETAIESFEGLGGFKDSAERAAQIKEEKYAEAELVLDTGNLGMAAAIFGGLKDYRDSAVRSQALWNQIVTPTILAGGGWFSAAIGSDRVYAVGDNRDGQCKVSEWNDVVSVSAGWSHIVGRKNDGTVVSAGYNTDGRAKTSDWKNVVDVSAGQWHTVALLSNGTVVGTGCSKDGRLDISKWKYITAVSAGRNHTVALLWDGTVLATGRNEENQCDVSTWSGVAAISAGGEHTLALRKNGTVLAAGSAMDGACNVQSWTDIVSISAGYYHSVGLRSDGTVVATGSNLWGQCNVSDWKNIVAVAAGGWHTLGLRSDGTVLAAGRTVNGQCDTAQWTNMKSSS